ncbi:hypothetical protein [Amnibacterium endophyticum]|uniref:Uncharacterized protein n=1 Tax=Amnibacterium endophyticum TaxID=2109337 RepID=A0ABW4LIV3_9MICO
MTTIVDVAHQQALDLLDLPTVVPCEAEDDCEERAEWLGVCPSCANGIAYCRHHFEAWPRIVVAWRTVTHDDDACGAEIRSEDIRWVPLP